MARLTLTDSPRWFNDSTATKFDEDSRWDGNNHISRATGSQWDHQALYYTASGRWILNSWSQWQGTEDTYEEVSQADAIDNERFATHFAKRLADHLTAEGFTVVRTADLDLAARKSAHGCSDALCGDCDA